MADEICTSSKEEAILIEKINNEREKILHLINNSFIGRNAICMPVFNKYLVADKAFLNILQQPDCENAMLESTVLSHTSEENLRLELQNLEEDLKIAVIKAQENKENAQRLEKKINEVNEMMMGYPESIDERNIVLVEENVMRRFQKERKQLKLMLSAVLPDDTDTRDVLSQLVEAAIKQPGSYISVEDTDTATQSVAFLVKSGLCEIHPEQPLQVRMLDLL